MVTPQLREEMIALVDGFFETYRHHQVLSEEALRLEYCREGHQKKYLMLVRIINNQPFIEGHELEKRVRTQAVIELVQKLVTIYQFDDTEFLVNLGDGNEAQFPIFGVIRPQASRPGGLIPFPVGNHRGYKEGWATPVVGWEDYAKKNIMTIGQNYPWDQKISKGVWRGAFKMMTWAAGKFNHVRSVSWGDSARGRLMTTAKGRPDLFDVGFSSILDKFHNPNIPIPDEVYQEVGTVPPIPFAEQQRYKYIIEAGNVNDWSERIRCQMCMNSVSILQTRDAVEFYTPLLKPFVHYIPTAGDFSDLVERIEWARAHDEEARQIVYNANQFAAAYLSEDAMYEYAYHAIKAYTKLLGYPVNKKN